MIILDKNENNLEKKSNCKGFTLYELIIVLGVISSCTALLLTQFDKIKDKYGTDTTELQELKEKYNFSYYDDLILPEPIDYEKVIRDSE